MHITLVHNFDLSAECGGNITNQENGVITTPNFPDKYSDSTEAANHQCHWFIHVNPGNRILLYFETFEVEGDPKGESIKAEWAAWDLKFLTKITPFQREAVPPPPSASGPGCRACTRLPSSSVETPWSITCRSCRRATS